MHKGKMQQLTPDGAGEAGIVRSKQEISSPKNKVTASLSAPSQENGRLSGQMKHSRACVMAVVIRITHMLTALHRTRQHWKTEKEVGEEKRQWRDGRETSESREKSERAICIVMSDERRDDRDTKWPNTLVIASTWWPTKQRLN